MQAAALQPTAAGGSKSRPFPGTHGKPVSCHPFQPDRVAPNMAFSEFEAKRCEKLAAAFVEMRRPPPHVRAQVDLGFRVTGQSVEIFELRADWRDASQMFEHPVAKTTFVKSRKAWKVLWAHSDGNWHLYKPSPEVRSLEEFLGVVEEDPHACFFG
jgi:hypothetical protein